jgi:hypothetical protein
MIVHISFLLINTYINRKQGKTFPSSIVTKRDREKILSADYVVDWISGAGQTEEEDFAT